MSTRIFRLIVTRDITESAIVEVEAGSEEAAHKKALNQASAGSLPFLKWQIDDGSASDDPYVTDCEEIG